MNENQENKNLFQTVFQGVEPPKEEEVTPPVEQPVKETGKVTENQTVVTPPVQQQVVPPVPPVPPTPTPVQVPVEEQPPKKEKKSKEDKKLNPLLRLIVYLLLIAAVLYSLYFVIYVPIQNLIANQEAKKEQLRSVERYLQDAQTSRKNNQQLSNFVTCQIHQEGGYCAADETFMNDTNVLYIETEEKVDSGTLFFDGENLTSGYISIHGTTYEYRNGEVKEQVKQKIEEEEEAN